MEENQKNVFDEKNLKTENEKKEIPDTPLVPEAESNSNTISSNTVSNAEQKIVTSHQSTYQVIQAEHGKEKTGFKIKNEVTLGDLTISFLLLSLLAVFILRWMHDVVWRR